MDGYAYPARDSMFQCSNYTRIWKILTSYYDKENILVLDGDKFTEDPVPVLQSVETFLDLPAFYSPDHFTYNGRCLLVTASLLTPPCQARKAFLVSSWTDRTTWRGAWEKGRVETTQT